jgi:hypothetical protein
MEFAYTARDLLRVADCSARTGFLSPIPVSRRT